MFVLNCHKRSMTFACKSCVCVVCCAIRHRLWWQCTGSPHSFHCCIESLICTEQLLRSKHSCFASLAYGLGCCTFYWAYFCLLAHCPNHGPLTGSQIVACMLAFQGLCATDAPRQFSLYVLLGSKAKCWHLWSKRFLRIKCICKRE